MTTLNRQTDVTLGLLLQDFVAPSRLTDLEIHGISHNSTDVGKGDLFVAQAGLTRHAIDYAADAIGRGAVAVIYDASDVHSLQRVQFLSKQFSHVSFVAVPDLMKKIGAIASRFYGEPAKKFKLIGITGTDGKTSVTHLLVQVLTRLGKKAGSVGTLGYGVSNDLKMTGLTTPDAISLQSILFELAVSQCEFVVMEVSSHALDQYRVAGCQFDIAVLTNLGSDHLDYHENTENYKRAKARLFHYSGLSARVLNMDDAFGRQLAGQFDDTKVTGYSAHPDAPDVAEVRLLSSAMGDQGIEVTVATPRGELFVRTALIGDFNIENLLACISTLLQMGLNLEQIEQGMNGLQPIPGRMQYFPARNGLPAVVIDFAHTEQALSACLKALANYASGEMICVFGCGGDRDQSKRPRMAAVAEQLADQVIVTDDNPRNEAPEQIMREILAGFRQPDHVRVIHDRQLAIETAMREASEQDLVVIAGKGHEQVQIIGEQRMPFSDHHVVRSVMNEVSQ